LNDPDVPATWPLSARIAWANASIFLPPYSTDLNSIEQVLAKLKTLLRKARGTIHRDHLATHRVDVSDISLPARAPHPDQSDAHTAGICNNLVQ